MRLLPPSTAHQEAQELPIMQGKIPGVGLEEQGVVTKHLGEVLPHYISLAMFGNLEVFFVSLYLLSHCFVILIKYSRAQKGTQVLCHKLHLTISPSVLQQFPQSQWHPKELEKIFLLIPVTS